MYEKKERERDSANLIWMRGRWMSEYIYTLVLTVQVFSCILVGVFVTTKERCH